MTETLIVLNERTDGTERSYNVLGLALGEFSPWTTEADKILVF
jgi:hypothetical protein